MCCGCWKENGAHENLPEGWQELVEIAKDMNGFGGFHIVVEDFNVEDHHFKFCMENPDSLDYEIEWGKKMLALPLEQRVAIMGLVDGCFKAPKSEQA